MVHPPHTPPVRPIAPGQIVAGSGAGGVTVFAGFGWRWEGTFLVPEGTMIRLPAPHDGRLLDFYGTLIERTGRIPEGLLTEGYWPGMLAPELVLAPPTGLNTLPTSTIVTRPTALSDLVRPEQGVCLWAACTVWR